MTDARPQADDAMKVSKDHPAQAAAEQLVANTVDTGQEFATDTTTVRSAIPGWEVPYEEHPAHQAFDRILDALASLAARVREIEAELRECPGTWPAAEARVDAAEQERGRDAIHIRDLAADKAVLAARVEQLEGALAACRELFTELRGDWSDNRGPCREGFAIIDAALAGGRGEGNTA